MVQEATEVCIPREIVATLKGRRFTLVGFPSEEANLIARVVKDTKSLSYSVNPMEAEPESETVKACDLVMLNLTDGLVGSQWLDINPGALEQKAVLLVGFPSEILDYPAIECAAQDVLVRPFEPEEMLLRSYRLLSRVVGARAVRGTEKKTVRVMLADDDPSTTNLISALLKNHHIETSVASNGEAALRGARRLLPDLVLLDLDMPRMNGFEVLTALRKEPGTQALKVILLTADQDSDNIAKGGELGADDYIIKPFSPGDLVIRIKRLLYPSSPLGADKPPKVFIR